MTKTLGLFFIILMAAFLFFYFWASSANIDNAQQELISAPIDEDTNYRKGDTLTIMTFNIGYLSGMTNNLAIEREELIYKNNLSGAKTLIRNSRPDIIGFQEIDIDSDRSYHYNQVDSLTKATNFDHVYTSINWDKKYVPFPYWPIRFQFGQVVSGQSIISQFPIAKGEDQVLIKPLNAPFYYNDFYLDRLIQIVTIKVGDQDVIVMNVHLEAFDMETRQLHLEALKKQYLKYSIDYPVILMGDFNSNYSDQEAAMQSLLKSKYLRACYDRSTDTNNFTFSSENPSLLLDYIFYNDNWIKKIDAKILKEANQISDHLPVLMRFTLKDKNAW
jgi:endonuclease/exonuclease/phosphatase family metal-dependent hydrolase